MILVTGATGQLGQLAIQSILTQSPNESVIAGVRSIEKARDLLPESVTPRALDYNNVEQVSAAMSGITTLVLISGNDLHHRASQHATIVHAAAQAGVQHLIYTSILNAPTSPMILATDHVQTESLIRESGLAYTILRNGWYTENYAGAVGTAIQLGQIFGASGVGKISAASRQDYADAIGAAVALGAQNQAIELAGSTSFTMTDFANEMASQLGRPVEFVNLSQADYESALVSAGLPQDLAAILADADASAAHQSLYGDPTPFESLIGRPTIGLSDAIKALLERTS